MKAAEISRTSRMSRTSIATLRMAAVDTAAAAIVVAIVDAEEIVGAADGPVAAVVDVAGAADVVVVVDATAAAVMEATAVTAVAWATGKFLATDFHG